MIDGFLISAGIVALAEIGDKTHLLALVLATKFRAPRPIIAGILVATLLNHALAGAAGSWIATQVDPVWMRWVVGGSFLAMAIWTLVPDRYEGEPTATPRFGVFVTTLILFFIVEMGDKTQIATAVLTARFDSLAAIVAGTTAGMLLVNAPVVWFGDVIAQRVSLSFVRSAAALAFAALGIVTLMGVSFL